MHAAKKISRDDLLNRIIALIGDILGEGGIASKKKGFMFNKSQFDYAIRTAEGFFNKDQADVRTSINALQAATGTGKTIGYLVPLMLYVALSNKRVAVSTYTKQLQAQILNEDALQVVDWVAQVTHVKLSVARRIGMQSYASRDSCHELLAALRGDNSNDHADSIAFLENLIEWLSAAKHSVPVNSGVLDDFLDEFNYEEIPDHISARMLCDIDKDDLAYQRDIENSKTADVLIVNHALVAINAISANQFLDDEKSIDILVCDEADRLPDVAASIAAVDMSLYQSKRHLQEFAEDVGRDDFVDDMNALLDATIASKPHNDTYLQFDRLDNSTTASMKRLLKQLITTLGDSVQQYVVQAATKVGDIKNNTHKHQHIVDIFYDLNKFYEELSGTHKKSSCIISWSPVKSLPSFRSASSNAGRLYQKYLRGNFDTEPGDDRNKNRLTALLLTSATLATIGKVREQSFDMFLSELGIFRLAGATGKSTPIFNVRTELLNSYEPVSFGKMSFVLPDPRVVDPKFQGDDHTAYSSSEWLDYIADMIRAAHARGKRTMVLTTSFVDTEVLGKCISDLKPLVHVRSTSLAQLLPQYKENPNAILITPSAWEGVNLPGMVNELIIPKIPFTSLNSSDFEIHRLELAARGHDQDSVARIIFGRLMVNTKRKLGQGIGRGLRSKNDVCTLWLGDPRFPLPESITHSLDDIILDAPVRKNNSSLVDVIPHRFKSNYERAPVFNKDTKDIYQPLRL